MLIRGEGSYPGGPTSHSPAKTKKTVFYEKYKENIAELANQALKGDSIGSTEALKLAEKMKEEITIIEHLLHSDSIDEVKLDTNLTKLMIDCLKLQRQYLFAHAALAEQDSESTPLPIPLPLFLKQIDKIDKLLLQSSHLSKEESSQYLEDMIQFITSTTVLLKDLKITPTPLKTASECYFASLNDSGHRIMVFKPQIEVEAPKKAPPPFASLIPKDQKVNRQIASFLIDRKNEGKMNVPLSAVGFSENEGAGSVQIYKKNNGPLENLGGSAIVQIPADKLQLLTIHRGRLYDLDCHLGNVLYKAKTDDDVVLIPIDFDFTLPEIKKRGDIEKCMLKMGWRFFPQMNLPFSKTTRNYLKQIDLDAEINILIRLGISENAIRLFKITTWAFQKGAEKELLPGEIIDFINSDLFKELCLKSQKMKAVKFDESMKELLNIHLENYKYELNAAKEFVKNIREDLENKKFEGVVYNIQNLFSPVNNRRLGFLMIEELILSSYPNLYNEAIEHLKTYSGKSHEMYDGFCQLVFALETTGRNQEAQGLRDWITENFLS